MACLDGLQEVLGSVVDAFNDIGITLGIGSPLDNDLVKTIGSLELATLVVSGYHD
jgi:hypothetical protein